MSKGPEQVRFERALEGSSADDVMAAALQWRTNAHMLGQVAQRLRAKASDAHGISRQTGPAMANAFTRSAEAMDEKSTKMAEGADALQAASTKLKAAEDARAEMRPLSDPGTYTGPSQPKTKEEVAAKGQYDTALATYQQDKDHNERIARQHNTAMDSQNETSTAVMKSIHGEPDPEPQPTAATGTTGARSLSGASGHGTTYMTSGGSHTGSGSTTTWQPQHTGGSHDPTGGSTHGGTHGTGTTGTGTSGPGTGTPSGSTVANPGTPTLTSPLTAAGGPGPSAGASVGGVGAALGAGALGGVGTALGGIKGGSIPVEGPVAGSGGRPIGSTTRAASSGTLGRGSLARAGALTEAEEGAAARSGASRAGAAGSTSRTGAGAGSRNGAAGRGGRGGGSAGGGSRRNKRNGSSDHDHLMIDEDWIDDEGEAPSVLA